MSVHNYTIADVNTPKLVFEILDGLGKQVFSSQHTNPDGTMSYYSDTGELRLEFDPDLTPSESDNLDSIVAAHVPGSKTRHEEKYRVETVSAGLTQKVEWFATDNGSGAYSDLAKDEVYDWNGSTLLSITTTAYTTDGAVVEREVEYHYTTGTGKRVRKKTNV